MTREDPGHGAHRGDDAGAGLLAHHDIGTATGTGRLVLLHGFTQTSQCWAPFAELLAAAHQLRLVDAPGHGASGHDAATVADAAALLGRTGGVATYVGYSMGGRVALRLALDAPHLVERLVLIGASPGLAERAERAERVAHDDALAARLEGIGLAAFLEEWLAQPLFAGLAPERAHRPERMTNRVEGLAASLRAAGTGTQEPLWDRLATLAMPVLVLVGADDHKFAATARAMAARIGPRATVTEVPGAGHTAHLEQPERAAAIVLEWLRLHPR